jgi:hypothetical protein
MDAMDRLVIVPAASVADLCDIVDRVLPQLDEREADQLRGVTASMLSLAVLEPVG